MTTQSRLQFDANLRWLFTELPFERRFEAAAAAGFEAVEIPSPYEHPMSSLQAWLSGAGLDLILINAPVGAPGSDTANGMACVPELADEFRAGFEKALEYAVALNARLIHVLGGVRPLGISRDRAFATYLNNIGWAADRSSVAGISVVLEPINQRDAPGFVLESLAQTADVVQAIGADRVGVMFDVYHCQVTEGDITVRLRDLMPLVAHIQVADVPHRTDPGTGEIGWEYVFEQIKRLGYAGWIGCEYRPVDGTGEGMSWIEKYTGLPLQRTY
jgi:hydroxypyruvate isomerase